MRLSLLSTGSLASRHYTDTVPRRLLCWLLSVSLFCLTVCNNPAWAQSGGESSEDTQPPKIELTDVAQGNAGEIQVFNASVTDDQELLAVLFFYRFAGDAQFISIDMDSLEGTQFFTSSVATTEGDTRNIEYFIQAEDTAGNRSIKGFTFDPLVRSMVAVPAVADSLAAAPAVEPEKTDQSLETSASANGSAGTGPKQGQGSNNRTRVMWGLAGLAVVAVVALLLSRDDGGDDSDSSPTPITLSNSGGSPLSIQW